MIFYLKCVGIFFLVYSLTEALKGLLSIRDKKASDTDKILFYTIGCTVGGFWLFLLIKIISSMGANLFD